jgi:hypothetical protein
MIKIDQAFVSTIMAGGLGLDIVHENGGYSVWGVSTYTSQSGVYTPNAQRAYLEIKTFPSGRTAFSLAHSDDDVGLFQCIVRYPIDTGAVTAKTKAEAVRSLFPVGGSISYQGQTVFIESNTRDGGRVETGFYQIVVRANYRAFVNR